MSRLRVSLVLMLACSCGNPGAAAVAGAPAVESRPPPIELPPEGATLRISQRTQAAVPGARDAVVVSAGDITGGRVSIIVAHSPEGTALTSGTVAQGEGLSFTLDGHGYTVVVELLHNELIGDDWATLRFKPEAAKPPRDAPVLDERARIEALLEVVRTSGITFIRNGGEHDAAAAVKHLRDKWARAGDQIKTAAEFIDQLATRSSQSGEAYRVRLPDGSEREAGRWLHEQLAAL